MFRRSSRRSMSPAVLITPIQKKSLGFAVNIKTVKQQICLNALSVISCNEVN